MKYEVNDLLVKWEQSHFSFDNWIEAVEEIFSLMTSSEREKVIEKIKERVASFQKAEEYENSFARRGHPEEL